MLNKIELHLREYPVTLRDERTGEVFKMGVIIEKGTLEAAGRVGLSDRDLIHQHCNKRGFWVLEIFKPKKKTVTINLADVYIGRFSDDGRLEVIPCNLVPTGGEVDEVAATVTLRKTAH